MASYWLVYHEDDPDGAWRADTDEELELIKEEVGWYSDPFKPVKIRLMEEEKLCPHHIHEWIYCPWCDPYQERNGEQARIDVHLRMYLNKRRAW